MKAFLRRSKVGRMIKRSVGTDLSHWPKSNLINLLIKLHGLELLTVRQVPKMACSFARAASSTTCGNLKDKKTKNSELLLTPLETLTAQTESWKIQEKELLLNRAGNFVCTYTREVI